MGLVVAATHLQLERTVAIKFLLPQHLAKTDVVSRFTREARAAAKIQNDHVAHVLDVGVEDGCPYMVMEYLEGEDLKQVLTRRGPLGVEEAVRYIMHACEALSEAHSLGIVHRDLKPANLFLASRANGRSILKVLDFGISKIMNPATETELTLTSRAVGSPSYMSPEQLTASRSLDARADVWGLGVVLYELLTKRRPFYGETMPAMVAQILKGKYEPLDALRPELPLPILVAVHKCLELEPDQRYQSVTELALALAPFAPTESVSSVEGVAKVRMPSTVATLAGDESIITGGHGQTGIASVVTTPPRPLGANRARLRVVAAAVALLTLGLGAAFAFGPGRTTARTVATTLPAPSPAASAPAPASGPLPVAAAAAPATGSPDPAPLEAVAPVVKEPAATAEKPATADAAAKARGGARPSTPRTTRGVAAAPAPSPASAPAAAVAPAPACHLVTYFDAQGDKHFKEECP
jgi:serine/threonine-protein kinase